MQVKNKKNIDTIKRDTVFDIFLKKFQCLTPPIKFASTCFSISDDANYKELNIDSFKSLLNDYEGPAISIGYLSDTTNYFAVIYCTASSCYLPNLGLYDKSGKLLQSIQIASGCGFGPEYECKESIYIKKSNEIVTTKNEVMFELDSLGNRIDSSRQEYVTKIIYLIKNNHIYVDSIR